MPLQGALPVPEPQFNNYGGLEDVLNLWYRGLADKRAQQYADLARQEMELRRSEAERRASAHDLAIQEAKLKLQQAQLEKELTAHAFIYNEAVKRGNETINKAGPFAGKPGVPHIPGMPQPEAVGPPQEDIPVSPGGMGTGWPEAEPMQDPGVPSFGIGPRTIDPLQTAFSSLQDIVRQQHVAASGKQAEAEATARGTATGSRVTLDDSWPEGLRGLTGPKEVVQEAIQQYAASKKPIILAEGGVALQGPELFARVARGDIPNTKPAQGPDTSAPTPQLEPEQRPITEPPEAAVPPAPPKPAPPPPSAPPPAMQALQAAGTRQQIPPIPPEVMLQALTQAGGPPPEPPMPSPMAAAPPPPATPPPAPSPSPEILDSILKASVNPQVGAQPPVLPSGPKMPLPPTPAPSQPVAAPPRPRAALPTTPPGGTGRMQLPMRPIGSREATYLPDQAPPTLQALKRAGTPEPGPTPTPQPSAPTPPPESQGGETMGGLKVLFRNTSEPDFKVEETIDGHKYVDSSQALTKGQKTAIQQFAKQNGAVLADKDTAGAMRVMKGALLGLSQQYASIRQHLPESALERNIGGGLINRGKAFLQTEGAGDKLGSYKAWKKTEAVGPIQALASGAKGFRLTQAEVDAMVEAMPDITDTQSFADNKMRNFARIIENKNRAFLGLPINPADEAFMREIGAWPGQKPDQNQPFRVGQFNVTVGR